MKRSALLQSLPDELLVDAPLIDARQCIECLEHKPVKLFLPSSREPSGRISRCLDCIKSAAERDRLEREKKFAEAAARAAAKAEKTCRSCKLSKPLTEYAKHRLSRDGHRHDCRSCVKANKAKVKPKTPEQIRREKERAAEAHRRAANRIAVKIWSENNPEAVAARRALHRAVAKGIVTPAPSCQVLNCTETRIDGHHHNYSRPTQVLWLCRAHHRQLHAGRHLDFKAGVDRKLARLPNKSKRSGKTKTGRRHSSTSSHDGATA